MLNNIKIEKHPFHYLPYRSSFRGKSHINLLPFFFATADNFPENVDTIVLASDLQGVVTENGTNRLLGYALIEALQSLIASETISSIDLLLLAGDLYDDLKLEKKGADGDVTELLNGFAQYFHNVVCVHGNHDVVRDSALSKELTVLDGDSVFSCGLKIGGVSGIIGDPSKPQRKNATQYMRMVKTLVCSRIDLLLLHQSPQGNTHLQIGDIESSQFLAKNGKLTVVSGHCDWCDNPIAKLGENTVLNVDSRVILLRKAE